MFRQIPVANKICFDKDLKRKWKIHEKNLRELKCSLDFKQPQHFDFLTAKPKRDELDNLRNVEIMRENQVLLNKISNITIQGNLSRELKKQNSGPLKRTLNQSSRKKNLDEISRQNHSMLKRIQERKSCYNNKSMAKQRARVQKNIHLISLFPYKDYAPNKTPVNLWMTNSNPTQRGQADQTDLSSSLHAVGGKHIQGQIKKTRRINNSYYLVTCFCVSRKFTIQLQNLESPAETYVLNMEEAQAQNFLRTYFDNNVVKMIDSLCIDQKDRFCYLKYDIQPDSQTVRPQQSVFALSSNQTLL